MAIVLPICPKQAAETSVPVSGPAQVPQAPDCAGGGWGRASSDGTMASLARRLSEGWYWDCAGALQAPHPDIAKNNEGWDTPKSSLGRSHVTRADWSQLAAERQEDSEGQDVPPVPGQGGAQHQAQGGPWAVKRGLGIKGVRVTLCPHRDHPLFLRCLLPGCGTWPGPGRGWPWQCPLCWPGALCACLPH